MKFIAKNKNMEIIHKFIAHFHVNQNTKRIKKNMLFEFFVSNISSINSFYCPPAVPKIRILRSSICVAWHCQISNALKHSRGSTCTKTKSECETLKNKTPCKQTCCVSIHFEFFFFADFHSLNQLVIKNYILVFWSLFSFIINYWLVRYSFL